MSENGAAGKVLLVSATAWPACAKLAIAFLSYGCEVEAVCASGHPLAYVSGIQKIYPYRACTSLHSLEGALETSKPDLIVPCDDGVVRQLHHLHRTVPTLRGVIERSLGAPESYEIVDSRAKLMRTAEELGVRVAETLEVDTVTGLENWFASHGGQGVLKIDDTHAGKGVRIIDTPVKAERALTGLRRKPGLVQATLRWHALHDVLGVWRWQHYEPSPVTVQRYIKGTPANSMIACKDGELLGIVSVRVLWSEGETGPAFVVQVIENDDMKMAAERLVKRLKLSGFHGLDFILDTKSGEASLIELNPRCTQLGHLAVCDGGDLAGLLCRQSFPERVIQMTRLIPQRTIAFFPQVLFATGKRPPLANAFIDTPWSEPTLVTQLARCDWRNRRWLARIYSHFRPSVRSVVELNDFEEARSTRTSLLSA
jgi:hypothetical protein